MNPTTERVTLHPDDLWRYPAMILGLLCWTVLPAGLATVLCMVLTLASNYMSIRGYFDRMYDPEDIFSPITVLAVQSIFGIVFGILMWGLLALFGSDAQHPFLVTFCLALAYPWNLELVLYQERI